MGSSTSCYMTSCGAEAAAIPPWVHEFDNEPVGASYTYHINEANSNDCGFHSVPRTVYSTATMHPYKTPKPSFLGDYDTGRWCLDNVNCNISDDRNKLKSVDLGAKYMEILPTYSVKRSNAELVDTYDGDHPQNKYRADKTNYNFQLKKAIPIQEIRHIYNGQFGGSEAAGPNADERTDNRAIGKHIASNVIKRENILWTYTVDNDINYFSDAVFADWLFLIQTEKALAMLLNEIREFVNANPGLILLNKVNTVMGKYARKTNKDEKGFVDLPFGPPLIRIPNTYVLQYKGYYANHKIDKTIDAKNAVYAAGAVRPVVVNSIVADKTASEYKPFNYLDNVYSTLNTWCSTPGCVNKDSVVTITIPMRGCQLFEAVSSNQDTGSEQRIKVNSNLVSYIPISAQQGDAESLVKNGAGKLPQLVMRIGAQLSEISSWQQSADTTNSQAAAAYELLTGGLDLHVPIVNIKRQPNGYLISINTLSDSLENKVFMYIANPSKTLGSYLAKCHTQNNTSNGRQMNIVSVEYDGQETKETPVILVNRYNPKSSDE